MREIKFRAWNNNKMWFVSSIRFDEGRIYLSETEDLLPDTYVKINDEKLKLMQYTGFEDKNGKEIYESDIVKSTLEYNAYTGMKSEIYGGQVYEVIWDNAKFKLSPFPIENHFVSWNDLEVIGNIFENPEL